jgi:HlyD family secretion protein
VKTWVVRGLLLLLVAGAAVGGVFAYHAATRPPELTFRTAKVERGSIVARVTATGTLSAHVTVQVGAQVSGRLADIYVDFNSLVKKGQVIARLDPELYKAAQAQARANTYQAIGVMNKSKATLDNNVNLLSRAKDLRAAGLLSQQDYDTAVANVEIQKGDLESQKGNVEQARAQEHQADINLAYCTIISPIDGTVILRAVDVGQTVAASLSAPVLFTIAEDLHKMQVDTNVTEGDVGKLRDGMRATFVVDAYANERFNGVIQQIRNAATTVQNVVTYDAVIEVENMELKLRPGMTANATINYDRREDVLRVPNAALRFRPPPALLGSASAAPPASGPPAESGAASAEAHPGATPVSAEPRGDGGRRDGGRRDGGRRDGGRGDGGRGDEGGDAGAAPSGSASARPRRGRGGAPTDPTEKVLWVMRGALPVPVTVHVGLTDGSFTEIVSGEVQDGDAVVLEVTTGDEAPATTSRPSGGANQPPRMRL